MVDHKLEDRMEEVDLGLDLRLEVNSAVEVARRIKRDGVCEIIVKRILRSIIEVDPRSN